MIDHPTTVQKFIQYFLFLYFIYTIFLKVLHCSLYSSYFVIRFFYSVQKEYSKYCIYIYSTLCTVTIFTKYFRFCIYCTYCTQCLCLLYRTESMLLCVYSICTWRFLFSTTTVLYIDRSTKKYPVL